MTRFIFIFKPAEDHFQARKTGPNAPGPTQARWDTERQRGEPGRCWRSRYGHLGERGWPWLNRDSEQDSGAATLGLVSILPFLPSRLGELSQDPGATKSRGSSHRSHPRRSHNPCSGATQPAAGKERSTRCPEPPTDFTSTAARSGPPGLPAGHGSPSRACRAQRSRPRHTPGAPGTTAPSVPPGPPCPRNTDRLRFPTGPSMLDFLPLAEILLGT